MHWLLKLFMQMILHCLPDNKYLPLLKPLSMFNEFLVSFYTNVYQFPFTLFLYVPVEMFGQN